MKVERIGASVRWSPDGSHLVIGWVEVLMRSCEQEQQVGHGSLVIVSVNDGALTPSRGWIDGPAQEVFFSPDGSRVAYRAEGSFVVLDLHGTGRHFLSSASLIP